MLIGVGGHECLHVLSLHPGEDERGAGRGIEGSGGEEMTRLALGGDPLQMGAAMGAAARGHIGHVFVDEQVANLGVGHRVLNRSVPNR